MILSKLGVKDRDIENFVELFIGGVIAVIIISLLKDNQVTNNTLKSGVLTGLGITLSYPIIKMVKDHINKKNSMMFLVVMAGFALVVFTGWYKFGVFVESPVIDVGQNGTVSVALTEALQKGGYSDFKSSVWVDGELLCCHSLNSGAFSCKIDNPEHGSHDISVFVVSYSGSAFAGGDICNSVDYPDNNLVTESGVQKLRENSDIPGAVFRFDEKNIRWYVVPDTTTTSSITTPTTTPETTTTTSSITTPTTTTTTILPYKKIIYYIKENILILGVLSMIAGFVIVVKKLGLF